MPSVPANLRMTLGLLAFLCAIDKAALSRLPVRSRMLAMLCAEWLKASVVRARGHEASSDVLWFYGLSFIATAVSCLLRGGTRQVRLMAGMQLVWATRLATFLSIRQGLQPAGSQTGNSYGGVVEKIRGDAWLQLNASLIAGLWRICTCIPLWLKAEESEDEEATAKNERQRKDTPWLQAGIGIWLAGLTLESVADLQKAQWAASYPGRFVNTGLWRIVQHPNYLGEILVWVGHFVAGMPYASPTEWLVAASSPTITLVLLRCVSGVPLVQKAARAKWGHEPGYVEYATKTPLLWPFLWPGLLSQRALSAP